MAEVFELDSFSIDDKIYIQDTLNCDGNEIFDIYDAMIHLPFAFARDVVNDIIHRPLIPTEDIHFTGELRKNQSSVYNYVVDKLNTDGAAIISAYPGFGKTITTISIASNFKVKTLIVVNRIMIIDQWLAAINEFSSAKATIIKPTDEHLDPNFNFYIVNSINIGKKGPLFWKDIKLLIVDELHQIITKKIIVGLLKINPDAVLGLSATPYRNDEYHKAIKWFFGKNLIGKELNQAHTYRIVYTNYIPQNIQYGFKGLDWGKILEDQAADESRNNCIVTECLTEVSKFKTVLVLVKRVNHANILDNMIKQRNPDIKVATLVRSDRVFDKQCQILIGTTSKIGVGFDHAAINCLIVAADIKNYFIQFLGRCMRNPDIIPSVVDFYDNFNILKNHLSERIKEYKNHGGKQII